MGDVFQAGPVGTCPGLVASVENAFFNKSVGSLRQYFQHFLARRSPGHGDPLDSSVLLLKIIVVHLFSLLLKIVPMGATRWHTPTITCRILAVAQFEQHWLKADAPTFCRFSAALKSLL